MKKSTTALLYSTFVFPGAGLFVIGKKKEAYIFLGLTCSFLIVVIIDAYHKAQIIADDLVRAMLSNGSIDREELNQMIKELPTMVAEQLQMLPSVFPAGLTSTLSWALAALWLLGVVETFRRARYDDHANNLNDKQSPV